MKAIHFYFILFLVGIGYSCKKKAYPESTKQNEVVYYFNATVDNSAVSLEAGNNNYYMFSSLQQDIHGVYNFVSDLNPGNCSTCPNSLRISINDFKISQPGAPVMVDSSFRVKAYPIQTTSTTAYLVKFNAISNKSAVAWKWDFGDGNTDLTQNPAHIYSRSGIYAVRLTITGADGCESNIVNVQKIGLAELCKTAIVSGNAVGSVLSFSQSSSGLAPYKYLWDFGDPASGSANTSTLSSPTHSYQIRGAYPVVLRVTDANNDVAISNYNAITQGDASSCATNYLMTSTAPVGGQQGEYNLSKVVINWVGANGNRYTSNDLRQPASSYFEIVSVEDYEANEKGDKTKKLQVKFKCMVYNGNDAVLIDNAKAVISVAYK